MIVRFRHPHCIDTVAILLGVIAGSRKRFFNVTLHWCARHPECPPTVDVYFIGGIARPRHSLIYEPGPGCVWFESTPEFPMPQWLWDALDAQDLLRTAAAIWLSTQQQCAA